MIRRVRQGVNKKYVVKEYNLKRLYINALQVQGSTVSAKGMQVYIPAGDLLALPKGKNNRSAKC